jgi:hypothetical protein
MVISFFLCSGGYGQAAQLMDRVSFTVESVTIEGDFSYDDVEMVDLIGQTLDLFVVVYDDTSQNSSVWDNDTGEQIDDSGAPPGGMTFISDGSYLLGRGLLRLLDVFNFVQPSYPSVSQVYGNDDGLTVYDYVFRMEEGSGFLFDYKPDSNVDTYGSIILYDDEGNKATVWFDGDQDSVQRVIINRPVLPVKAKAPHPLPIGGIR